MPFVNTSYDRRRRRIYAATASRDAHRVRPLRNVSRAEKLYRIARRVLTCMQNRSDMTAEAFMRQGMRHGFTRFEIERQMVIIDHAQRGIRYRTSGGLHLVNRLMNVDTRYR